MSERILQYSLAINEAIDLMMSKDKDVLLIGQGVKSPWYVGNTCRNLVEKYGEKRVIDTPVSENAMTGCAVGAAIVGMKAIVVHPRVDFTLYAFDPIINQAANWHYMSGGSAIVPVVFWLIVNRGGEQAAQHSQALQAMFAHAPGLKVVAPSDGYNAKGLLISSINDPNPVVFIDDRWLYQLKCNVPEGYYELPIGKSNIKSEGNDITIISSSWTTVLCEKAVKMLTQEGYSIELIDLLTLKPLDKETIIKSAMKTKKVLVVDGTWKSYGISAEIVATIAENTNNIIFKRLTLPDCPAPASSEIEEAYFIKTEDIVKEVKKIVNK